MSGIGNQDRASYLADLVRNMLARGMSPASVLTAMEEENRRYLNPPMSRQQLMYVLTDTQQRLRLRAAEAAAKEQKEKKNEQNEPSAPAQS